MKRYKHKLILYKDTKLTPNSFYKIDDIEDYLNGFDKLEFIVKPIELQEEISISLQIDGSKGILDDEYYLRYNYAKSINYYEILNDKKEVTETHVLETGYYFVTDFIKETSTNEVTDEGVVEFSLVLDVINTFLDKLNFTQKTLVTREHKNRFIQSYLKDDKYYFFRSFPPIITDSSIDFSNNISYRLGPFNDKNLDFWVKIVYFDSLYGELVFFLPLRSNNYNQLDSFLSLTYEKQVGMLTDVKNVSCSLVPYAPISLADYKNNSIFTIHEQEFNVVREDSSTYNFKVKVLKAPFLSYQHIQDLYPFYFDSLSLIKNEIGIEKLSDLIGNLLIFSVPKQDIDNYRQYPGVYGLFKRGNNIWDVNEPALLNSANMEKTITFSNGFVYNVIIENIIPKVPYFEYFQVGTYYGDFFNIQFKYKLVGQGALLTIKDGLYCKFDNAIYNLDFSSQIPLFTDQFRDYVLSGGYNSDRLLLREKMELEKLQAHKESQNQLQSAIKTSLRFGVNVGLNLLGQHLSAAALQAGWDAYDEYAKAEEFVPRKGYITKFEPRQVRWKGPLPKGRKHIFRLNSRYGSAPRTLMERGIFSLKQKYVRGGYAFSAFRSAEVINAWMEYFAFNAERQKMPIINKEYTINMINLDKKVALMKYNGQSVSSSVSYEDVIYSGKEFGLKVNINTIDNIYRDKLEENYYLFGYECSEYKIPTHNNRCLFDFLQCDADFENYRNVLKNEAFYHLIKEILKSGIFFIHHYNNNWYFETDHLENLESII